MCSSKKDFVQMKERILVCLQRSVTCQGRGLSHEGTVVLGLRVKVRKIVRGEKKKTCPLLNVDHVLEWICFILLYFILKIRPIAKAFLL